MEVKYQKIINLLEEKRGKYLTLERKYIPEIAPEDGWQINNNDGLPEFVPIVEVTIRYWNVTIVYDKDLIKFYIPKSFSHKHLKFERLIE